MQSIGRNYIFLDSEAERRQLCEEIVRVRDEVIQIIQRMPEDQWYEPRYHEWTPAAMLGHLNFIDNISMWQIKAALIGIRPRIGIKTVDRINNITSRMFHRRIVPVTIEGIRTKQEHIKTFVLQLPVSKFSKQIFDPVENKYTTVEKALQARFLHHWYDHLETIRTVEGIEQPPEERSDNA